MKERIKQLLIAGLLPSEIASIVGCSQSYISQLLKDDDFKAEVNAGAIEANSGKEEEEHIDKRYQTTEHLLLSAIKDKIPEASLGEVTRALETINKRKDDQFKRKNPLPQNPAGVNIHVISVALPQQILKTLQAPVVEMNSQKEIISIGNQALAPMSSGGVRNLFHRLMEKDQQLIEVAKEI